MTKKTQDWIITLLLGWIIPISDIVIPLWIFYILDSAILSTILIIAFEIFLSWLVRKIVILDFRDYL